MRCGDEAEGYASADLSWPTPKMHFGLTSNLLTEAADALESLSPPPVEGVERKIADDMAEQANRWRNVAGELAAALEPFAKTESTGTRSLKVSDFRRAREALSLLGCGEQLPERA